MRSKGPNEPTLSDLYRPSSGRVEEAPVAVQPSASSFPKTAFALSLFALLAPAILAGLVLLEVIPLEWDSVVVPALAVFVFIPLSVVALIVASVACITHRSKLAGAGILLGAIAVLVSLATAWLMLMIGLAKNPI